MMKLAALYGLCTLCLLACGGEAAPEIIALPPSQTPIPSPSQANSPSPTFQQLPTVTLAPTNTPRPAGELGAAPTLPLLPTFTLAPATVTATLRIPGRELQIAYFTSNSSNPIRAGEPVTLFWRAEGAEVVQIFRLDAEGGRSEVWNVNPEGRLTVSTEAVDDGQTARFLLAAGAGSAVIEETLEVDLSGCSLEWFFQPPPTTCPSALPLAGVQVQQSFEGGFMLWLEQGDQILVFYTAEQAWEGFPDSYIDGTSEPESSPPSDRYAPIRGFGLVWRENPEVQAALGWAIEPEGAYDGVQQAGEDGGLYLRGRGGDILALTDETWQILEAVESPALDAVPAGDPSQITPAPSPTES